MLITIRSFDFSQTDGLKITPDKLILFSKLKVRTITDAPRNVNACIVDGMFQLKSRVDLVSTFGGQANATLCRFVRCANHEYFALGTLKYPSINDITRDHGLV